MQHGARQVEHRTEVRFRDRTELLLQCGGDAVIAQGSGIQRAGQRRAAQIVQVRSQGRFNLRTPVVRQQLFQRRLVEETVE